MSPQRHASAADGHGQGIGHIRRLGRLGEVPKGLDGPLHLHLAGMPVAGQRLLDPVGREFLQPHAAPGGHQQDHPSGMAHQDGRAGMGIVGVNLLDGTNIRLMLVEYAVEFLFQLDEAMGNGRFDVEADDPPIDQLGASAGAW